MKSKEIFKKALNHQEGTVPIDFGSTAVTGMHVTCVRDLREYYGLKPLPVTVCEPYQMLGLLEEDLLAAIGVDVAGVMPRNNIFGFRNENFKTWNAPWGQELMVPENFNVSRKGNDIYIYPTGDTTAPPSGRMPEGGFFFDTIIRQESIDEDHLDPQENLEEFGILSSEDVEWYRKETVKAATGERGVVATFGGTGLGDIALVPAPFLKYPKGIRDITEWYISTISRQEYIHAIFSRQVEFALENLHKLHTAAGNEIDVVFLCGTDFGTQSGTFCSPETYLKLWHPYYKQMNDWIHTNTTWKVFKHCCGAVEPLLKLFIESGFDIINPVQCSARGMNPKALKRKFGKDLVFWGGGVDTQKTLPFGNPEDIRAEVLHRCEVFSQNGGFIFNAVHNVQAATPVKNIVAMLDAVKEFNMR